MNNFFLDASDYDLFKRALHETKNEPVVINIYSSDGSLQENENKDKAPVQRKNMSNKFEPSAFGKFFGPRKQRTAPVDMKDFSSWKNKNYRKTEQKLNQEEEAPKVKFSLADFMAEKARAGKYNELDQAKSDIQKPINQLSTEDPLYKRFSLDSYMHKLEEQSKVKNQFDENDDILEPLGESTAKIIPTSVQDENFGGSSTLDIESLAMDDPIKGDKFSFDRSELDIVKSRLEKIEREALNIKEKQTEKVLSGNELSALTKEDDDFDFSKLGIDDEDGELASTKAALDDIEKLNDKLTKQSTLSTPVDENDENSKSPKVDHKRYFEINKNSNVKRRFAPASHKQAEEDVVDQPVEEKLEDDDFSLGLTEEELNGKLKNESNDEFDSVDESLKDEIVVDETEKDESEVDETEKVDSEELEVVDEDLEESETDALEELDEEELDEDDVSDDEILDDVLTDGEDDLLEEYPTQMQPQTQPVIQPYGGVVAPMDPYTQQQIAPVGQDQMQQGYVSGSGSADVLTRSDFKSMTDELIDKFSQLYKKSEEPEVDPAIAEQERLRQEELLKATQEEQNLLKAKIDELTQKSKLVDSENELKLKQAALEKENVEKEYERKIKELQESYQKNYEAFKKQAYLEKMDNDLKLKKAQSDFKRREIKIKEHEKAISKKNKDVAILRKELKSNLNISKLESDKKLLELTSKENKKKAAEAKKVEEVKQEVVVPEVAEEVKTEKKTTARPKRKTTTTTRTKRKPRRKIDSDIIGGIDFE